jgi:hypothetical protein
MSRYYLITGLDEGVEIEHYGIDTKESDLNYHLDVYGDAARYCEPITKEEFIKVNKKGA